MKVLVWSGLSDYDLLTLLLRDGALTENERKAFSDMRDQGFPLSDRQRNWVEAAKKRSGL